MRLYRTMIVFIISSLSLNTPHWIRHKSYLEKLSVGCIRKGIKKHVMLAGSAGNKVNKKLVIALIVVLVVLAIITVFSFHARW